MISLNLFDILFVVNRSNSHWDISKLQITDGLFDIHINPKTLHTAGIKPVTFGFPHHCSTIKATGGGG